MISISDNAVKEEEPEVEEVLPIEHIKVEVDENANLAEDLMVEDESDGNKEQERVENIQCTPDICMFPESSEPDPMETVDCEEYNNSFM